MADAYVAVRACALLVYFVDADRRVTHTRHFDLARIAECSVASGSHVTTLAWLYREPLNGAFQVGRGYYSFGDNVKVFKCCS